MLVVPFYMLFSRRNRQAINAYLQRMGYSGRWRRCSALYRNHYYFAQAMVDRFALFVGLRHCYRVRITGNELLLEALNRPHGAILAGAHAGNMELAGYFFDHREKVFNGIVFGAEAKFLNRQRQTILNQHQVNLIPVAADMSHVVMLYQALERGEFLTLHCDRSLLGSKRVEASFLGAPAAFPTGAFQLAIRMDVPVLVLFMMREKSKCYHIIIRELNREAHAAAYVQAYASVLEEVLRQYPEQWYNYFDFWKTVA
jgi:predicted LPLAT superfamily acyltransferase